VRYRREYEYAQNQIAEGREESLRNDMFGLFNYWINHAKGDKRRRANYIVMALAWRRSLLDNEEK
jgi:hypothetical protein